MGNFKSNEGKSDVNLSLDNYIKQLKDYKEKAAKVFQMGGPNSYSDYVLSSLQQAIDVAQGKRVTYAERATVLKSAEELTQNALNFQNKFAQFKETMEQNAQENLLDQNKNEASGLSKRV